MKNDYTLTKMKFISMLAIGFAWFPINVYAQQVAPSPSDNTEQSRALTWANEMAEIAGGATYCRMELDLIEDFISRAHARIAMEANSDIDLVVSRIAFSNQLAAKSIAPPRGGCENFGDVFSRESARLD